MAVSTKPNFFLRRPVLSAVISIVITLVGALAMKALPIAQYPDLVPPTVNVSVSYPALLRKPLPPRFWLPSK